MQIIFYFLIGCTLTSFHIKFWALSKKGTSKESGFQSLALCHACHQAKYGLMIIADDNQTLWPAVDGINDSVQ